MRSKAAVIVKHQENKISESISEFLLDVAAQNKVESQHTYKAKGHSPNDSAHLY
jgi:thiamine phosphate synthase YjbQ (UPF0047 family)